MFFSLINEDIMQNLFFQRKTFEISGINYVCMFNLLSLFIAILSFDFYLE